MRVLMLVLLLAACASPNSRFASGVPYPTLEAATRAGFEASSADYASPSERAMAVECFTKSVVTGIPADDQAVILKAMNTKHYTPEATATFEKWIPTDSSSAEVGNAAIERVKSNALEICPDFMAKYPDVLG